jgi:hypothetical protein
VQFFSTSTGKVSNVAPTGIPTATTVSGIPTGPAVCPPFCF